MNARDALDHDACARAMLTRDARFDGEFFVAVHSTHIFCRPVCPAAPPRPEQVDFYRTAGEALSAGYRPCLRCVPEAPAGAAAWQSGPGIAQSALEELDAANFEGLPLPVLAARIGTNERGLRRAFRRCLGATPSAIVAAGRARHAGQLLGETDLSLAEVAMSAGFGSLRRFNTVVRAAYGRTPGQVREERAGAAAWHLSLPWREPYDWHGIASFLAPRAIPGVEAVTPDSYTRSFVYRGRAGVFVAQPSDGALRLSVQHEHASALALVAEGARRLFDLDADTEPVARHLAQSELLSGPATARPARRVPGAWDGFELGVRAILGQQVTVKGASTLTGRLVQLLGTPLEEPHGDCTHVFPSADVVAAADPGTLGVPRARGAALAGFAQAVRDGRVRFDRSQSSAELRSVLASLPGIGDWTAQYVALRGLGDPDAFPSSDLGLLHASGAPSPRELARIAEAWRPWRGYAALHLWSTL